jgi:hypothetical protein
VHEIDVDMVGLEPLQALLERGEDARAAAVAAVRHFVITDTKFGRYHRLVSAWPKRSRERLLGHAHAVSLRRVEAGDATVDCLRDSATELALVDVAISAPDLPAAKADRRYLEVGLAELPILHAFRSHIYRSFGRDLASLPAALSKGEKFHGAPALFANSSRPAGLAGAFGTTLGRDEAGRGPQRHDDQRSRRPQDQQQAVADATN